MQQVRDHGETVQEWIFGDDPDAPVQRSAYVEDPDGHIVELWTRDVATQTDGGPPRHVRTA